MNIDEQDLTTAYLHGAATAKEHGATRRQKAQDALQRALNLYEEAYGHFDVKALSKDSRVILDGMRQMVASALENLES